MKCVHGRDVGGFYGGECWECEQDKRRHREIVESIQQLGRPDDKETSAPSSRMGMDYGDYVCPHCRYKTLRRNASRCPQCHGDPGRDFWAQVDAKEQEKRRKEAEAAEKLRQRRVAEDDSSWRSIATRVYFLYLLPVLTVGTVSLKEYHTLSVADWFFILTPGLNLLSLFALLVAMPDFMLLAWKVALAWIVAGIVLSVLIRAKHGGSV